MLAVTAHGRDRTRGSVENKQQLLAFGQRHRAHWAAVGPPAAGLGLRPGLRFAQRKSG